MRGLTPADFTVLENGQPQEIAMFKAVDTSAATAASGSFASVRAGALGDSLRARRPTAAATKNTKATKTTKNRGRRRGAFQSPKIRVFRVFRGYN